MVTPLASRYSRGLLVACDPLGYTQAAHSAAKHRPCSTGSNTGFWHMSRLGSKT